MPPIPRLKPHDGPAILEYGFRPFFLAGSLFAGAAILVWLPVFFGAAGIPTAFAPVDWHVHEMLYGYVAAVAAGFLLTTIPNWTGRLPLQGRPLAVLVLVWLAGRLAVFASALIGPLPAAAIDVSFLLLLAAAAAREVFAGRNWRNLPPVGILALLVAANVTFHAEAWATGTAELGRRIAIAAVIALVMLVGGRVIPSFTRNWLVRRNPGRLPAPFGRFDTAALAIGVAALLAWMAMPGAMATAATMLLAGLVHTIRLIRWAGDRTLGDRLVLVLHVGYAFVPLGFVLLAGAIAFPAAVPASAGIHAWTAGAIGIMSLAIMTRASLGHTGRRLLADPPTQAIYAAAVIAVLARIGAAFHPAGAGTLLPIAGAAWAAAFLGFAAVYGPLLVRPRVRPR